MIKECDTTELVANGRKPLTKEEETEIFAKMKYQRTVEALQLKGDAKVNGFTKLGVA